MRSTALPRARTTPLLLPLVLLCWAVLSVSTAAHAGLLPTMRVTITPTVGYHDVCVHGDAAGAVVAWQLTISGVGTDQTIAPVFQPYVGPVYDRCYRIWKWGGDFAYVVTLTAAVAGGTTAPLISEGFGMFLNGQDYYLNSG